MSLRSAIEVLCCFSSEQPEWGITQLSKYLGLYKSSVYRFLVAFEEFGLVERTPSRRYRLGVRTLELGNVFHLNQDLLAMAERPLRGLAERTDSTVRLATLDKREVLVLLRTSGAHPQLFAPQPLLRMPIHSTSLGKVLLAGADELTFRRFIGPRTVLKQFTPNTIINPDKLRQHLQEVARAGFAMDDEECAIGQRCLAVPVRELRTGRVVAAIGLSSTRKKFDNPFVPQIICEMTAISRLISASIKCSLVDFGGRGE